MSVLNREEFFARLDTRLANDTSDEGIAFLEDMTDTYNDLERKANGDGVDWESKYKALDELEKRYRHRFFSGDTFHILNYQKFYKGTIQNEQLRQAFLLWSGITDLIAKVEADFHDNAKIAKWLVENPQAVGEAIAEGICTGFGVSYISPQPITNDVFYRVQVGAYKNKENAETLLKKLKQQGYDAFITTQGG